MARRQFSLPDHRDRHVPNNMDQLAFKYMELCKVENSTDSDSEISPRWSDTSTVGCVSSTPESGTFRQILPLTQKPAGRHGCYSLFLDPYDGSSEDSDESNIDMGVSSRRTRQQGKSRGGGGGGCRFSGRSRKVLLHHPTPVALRNMVKKGMKDPETEQHHLLDVQMKRGSDSELCDCDIMPSHSDKVACRDLAEEMASYSPMPTQLMDLELHGQFDDLCVHVPRASTSDTPVIPVEGGLSQLLDCSSERPPCTCNLSSVYKRKLTFPAAEELDPGQRKRQCVGNVDDEQEDWDSEAC